MAHLEINSLVKKFAKTKAINGITLKIFDGEMVGIIGKSGAGKSTLMKLINRLIEPTSGSITYNEVEITTLKGKNLREWRSECAMIFQQFNLIDRLDVLTNVLSGTLGINFKILKLFKFYSKREKIEALTYINNFELSDKALQRVGTLSGGQQQRVAIARAMMQKPKILLADEPISSLDPKNSKVVMNDIKRINNQNGITVICNLHSLDIAKQYCDRLIGLSEGKIVFDGNPSSLTNELAEKLYDLENE